ncbi:DNA repair protein RadC [Paenibacillus athensensis]|nr:DNA repair protein RadC [Paenibacillus athensensis]
MKALIAESLCEKQGSYMIEELFQKFPSAFDLIGATEQELRTVRGIGKGKSRQILALLKLSKAFTKPVRDPFIIRSPQNVFELLAPDLSHLQQEHFICLFLNTKKHVVASEMVSKGSLNAAIVCPREVFRMAIKRASASIICAHNHPSGDPSPSPEDIELTHRLVAAGEIIGIEVIDHVVIAGHRFYSLREKGLM